MSASIVTAPPKPLSQQGHRSPEQQISFKDQDDPVCSGPHGCRPRTMHFKNAVPQQSEPDEDFSVSSDLLKQYEPIDAARAGRPSQASPEVAVLTEVSLRIRKYEQLLVQCIEQQAQQDRTDSLARLKLTAQLALSRCKTLKSLPAVSWGHSIFGHHHNNKSSLPKSREQAEEQIKSKVPLKPVNERIKEYRRKNDKCKQDTPTPKPQGLGQTTVNAQKNAKEILRALHKQKLRDQESRKITKAKIKALQLKSMELVKTSKKKPLEFRETFDFGSAPTVELSAEDKKEIGKVMEARDEKEKEEKEKEKKEKEKKEKEKKEKEKKEKEKKEKEEKEKEEKQTKKRQMQVNKKTQAKPTAKQSEKAKIADEPTFLEKFYVWDVPITLPDFEAVTHACVGKAQEGKPKPRKPTFREEAEREMARRAEQRQRLKRRTSKEEQFQQQILRMKEQLQTQDMSHNSPAEVFWNEDEVFRATSISNFCLRW